MASSSLNIANKALLLIGADTITAITDDNTRGNACEELYEDIRDEVLVATRYGWNCAKKRVELTVEGVDPRFDYDYRYTKPSDCLRVLFLSDTNGKKTTARWEVLGKHIYSKESVISVVYICQLTDVAKFTPFLVLCIALQLAINISYRIKQSPELEAKLEKKFAAALFLAEGMEASERYSPPASKKWVDVK